MVVRLSESLGLRKRLPTDDVVFKRIFAREENLDVTAGLIRDFFNYEVQASDIGIVGQEAITPAAASNLSVEELQRWYVTRRDVTVEIEPAKVTIEMQVLKENWFLQRALFYLAELYTENYGKAVGLHSKFASLKPVWGLNILSFTMFDDLEPYRIFALRDEDDGSLLIDQNQLTPMRIGFFEIEKQISKVTDADNELAKNRLAWARFFATGDASEDAPEYIKAGARIMQFIRTDPREAAMISKEEAGLADLESVFVTAGFEMGESYGMAKGKSEIALNLLRDGIPLESVSNYTGLTVSQLSELTMALGSAGDRRRSSY